MKKICSLLMACMMILTGFSIPAFAMKWSKEDIERACQYDRMTNLGRKVNNVCELVLKPEVFYNGIYYDFLGKVGTNSCRFFEAMCASDLVAQYYASRGKEEEFKQYTAKRYWCAAGLIKSSESNRDNLLTQFKLIVYCFEKACKIWNETIDLRKVEVKKEIKKDGLDNLSLIYYKPRYGRIDCETADIRSAILLHFIEKYKEVYNVSLDLSEGEKLFCEILSEKPKNEDEFLTMLMNADFLFNGYNFNLLKENSILEISDLDALDDSDVEDEREGLDKSYSESYKCRLRGRKENEEYELGYILRMVLSGNFEFGPEGRHLGYGVMENSWWIW